MNAIPALIEARGEEIRCQVVDGVLGTWEFVLLAVPSSDFATARYFVAHPSEDLRFTIGDAHMWEEVERLREKVISLGGYRLLDEDGNPLPDAEKQAEDKGLASLVRQLRKLLRKAGSKPMVFVGERRLALPAVERDPAIRLQGRRLGRFLLLPLVKKAFAGSYAFVAPLGGGGGRNFSWTTCPGCLGGPTTGPTLTASRSTVSRSRAGTRCTSTSHDPPGGGLEAAPFPIPPSPGLER